MNNFCFFILVLMSLCTNNYADFDKFRVLYYNSIIPIDTKLRERVLTTVSCDDCKDIPKCRNAGQIISDKNGSYQLMHNGIKIIPDCYYGKWMTLLIELLQGHHEPQEEKAFYDVLPFIPPHAVMVELGSYWGYYSMWFKKEIQSAETYLIEPDYNNLLIGEKIFSLNNESADFTHAAVGSFTANEQPFINWEHEKSFVDQVSIDDFAKVKGIPYISILHSDIQGAEVDMLKGCSQLISEKRIGYLFISTHRGTHEKCLNILENTDYIILLSITREESFSADGLIVAKSPDIEGPQTFNISKRSNEFRKFIEELVNEQNAN